jgi:uncharacterized protein (TIGR02646 family)
MIKIRKPNIVPIVPDRGGKCHLLAETASNIKSYDASPSKYDDGILTFKFQSAYYGHDNIKTPLIKAQHGKCAFCEQNVLSIAYGDIEHFRPKGGYRQNVKDSLHYAGYYWLAYTWDNLMFACAICNQRGKANLFPLRNPELRATNHHDSIKREKPFFVNPAKENPSFLIGFKGPTAYGKDKNHRGKKTIESIGLNRKGDKGLSDLFEERNDYYQIMRQIYKIATATPGSQISQSDIDDSKLVFKTNYSPKKKFFAMVKDNFSPIP